MKLKLKLNKIMMAVVSIFVTATMMLVAMPTKVSAATITNDQSKIAMYSRECQWVYHATCIYTNYIKVAKSISYGKVYLYSKGSSNQWYKQEAQYVTSLDNDYNIYKAQCGEMGYISECYVSCEANGNTYIENNNGKNYKEELLGVAPIFAVRNVSGPDDRYYIGAVLKNLAYSKDVRVRYTVDNWKTYKEASLSYRRTLEDGTELWDTTIDISGRINNGFHYALSYKVNGQTYWDNYFGKNYDSPLYSPY